MALAIPASAEDNALVATAHNAMTLSGLFRLVPFTPISAAVLLPDYGSGLGRWNQKVLHVVNRVQYTDMFRFHVKTPLTLH